MSFQIRDDHQPTDILGFLEKAHYISSVNHQMIAQFMGRWKKSAYHALLETHLMSETALADAFSSLFGLARVRGLRQRLISEEAALAIGFRRSRTWECLPLFVNAQERRGLEVVIADPTGSRVIFELKKLFGTQFVLSVGERSDILAAIDELYPLSAQLPGLFDDLNGAALRP